MGILIKSSSAKESKRPIRRLTVSGLAFLMLLAGVTIILDSTTAVFVGISPNAVSYSTGSNIVVTVTVTYDTDEFLPVLHNRLIIEGPSPPASIIRDFRWTVNGEIITNSGCAALTVVLNPTQLGSVAGYGHQASATYLGRHTGYGYDSGNGHGASGYPTNVESNNNVFSGYADSPGAGYGYDAVAGQGTLTYAVTFPTSCVGTGAFRLTGELSTDYFAFQSSFTTVTVLSGSGGSGGGSGTTPTTPTTTTGTGAGQTQTVTATSTTTAQGTQFTTTIATAASGNTIVINTPGNAFFSSITLATTTTLTNSLITVTVGTVNPSTGLPSGVAGGMFLQVTVGGTTGTVGTISASISIPDTGQNPAQAALLHLVNSAWDAVQKVALTKVGASLTGSISSPCCSIFSVGFDSTPPTVTMTVPTGAQSGTVTLTATAADNLELARVEFLVDGVLASTDSAAPYEYMLDTTTLTNGNHTVVAKATDFVSNTAQTSDSSLDVQNAGAETPPPPATGGPLGKINTGVIVIIAIIVLILIVAAFMLAGKQPKKPLK